jgi:hypothetical protein
MLMLLSVAGGFAAAQYDQEKENKDATCDVSQSYDLAVMALIIV